MNNKELECLFKLLSETDINTFELEKANCKIKIKRGRVIAEPSQIQQPATAHAAASAAEAPKDEGAAAENDQKLKYIISPMVGTFYRAPSPDSRPFIEKGDKIEKEQVMCIIEAMKLFNEIESNIGGFVEEILVENGQPVEFGEKLFAIRIS